MMTAATAIREQVRVLALQIGLRESARILGLNEDTVCSWAKRYDWKVPSNTPGPESSASKLQATHVADVVASELADNERETRLSLSRYAKRAAKDAESATLKDAPYVKSAAQVAAITHKWNDGPTSGNHFTLNTLNINSLEVIQEATGEAN